MNSPAVWLPAVRCHSGTDTFTECLCEGLNKLGVRAEITWLEHRAEYAPWSIAAPIPPRWANIAHIASWLPPSLIPKNLSIVTTLHFCVHDSSLTQYKSPLQALYHRLWIYRGEMANLRRAQRVIAVSRYTAEKARSAFGVSDITVIHNGVDTKHFTVTCRSQQRRPFRLLYVGNWTARKGVDLLGPIMESLGSDFELRYTTDRAGGHRQYKLPLNCKELGRLSGESLVRAYQEADALLFPSRLEGLPLTVLEAMACGLPVIAADTSSLPEIIKHRVNGWLCSSHTAEAFVAACQELASDNDLWRTLSNAARKQTEEVFNVTRMVERYLEVYRGI